MPSLSLTFCLNINIDFFADLHHSCCIFLFPRSDEENKARSYACGMLPSRSCAPLFQLLYGCLETVSVPRKTILIVQRRYQRSYSSYSVTSEHLTSSLRSFELWPRISSADTNEIPLLLVKPIIENRTSERMFIEDCKWRICWDLSLKLLLFITVIKQQ